MLEIRNVSKQFEKNSVDVFEREAIDLSFYGKKIRHNLYGEGIIQGKCGEYFVVYFDLIGRIKIHCKKVKILEKHDRVNFVQKEISLVNNQNNVIKPIVKSEFIGKKVKHMTFDNGVILDEIKMGCPMFEIDFGPNGIKKMSKEFVLKRTDKIILI